ncbi:DUF4148 domain-containing protein [Paraburkholderia terrae]|uniref:DUF4148 domain-containing protein n=1 Tax=Paraburkholderia terrae TaxID=311230 RepID=A0A2I8F4E0_9BURK|nr:DUF4148 domain-containing protein [Paraburkholderia terrae]AUT66736.1 DUF4148 domain-containing protein [Paraburkholderia terrae]
MKALLIPATLVAILGFPGVSYSQVQQQAPLTRAGVRRELVQLRAAGYDPSDWVHYPQNIQAVEARVAARKANASYGPSTNGNSQSGQ